MYNKLFDINYTTMTNSAENPTHEVNTGENASITYTLENMHDLVEYIQEELEKVKGDDTLINIIKQDDLVKFKTWWGHNKLNLRKCAHLVGTCGSVKIFKFLVDYLGLETSEFKYVMENACINNNLNIVKALYEHQKNTNERIDNIFTEYGFHSTSKHILINSKYGMQLACINNHDDLIKFFIDQGCICDYIVRSIEKNYVEYIDKLIKLGFDLSNYDYDEKLFIACFRLLDEYNYSCTPIGMSRTMGIMAIKYIMAHTYDDIKSYKLLLNSIQRIDVKYSCFEQYLDNLCNSVHSFEMAKYFLTWNKSCPDLFSVICRVWKSVEHEFTRTDDTDVILLLDKFVSGYYSVDGYFSVVETVLDFVDDEAILKFSQVDNSLKLSDRMKVCLTKYLYVKLHI